MERRYIPEILTWEKFYYRWLKDNPLSCFLLKKPVNISSKPKHYEMDMGVTCEDFSPEIFHYESERILSSHLIGHGSFDWENLLCPFKCGSLDIHIEKVTLLINHNIDIFCYCSECGRIFILKIEREIEKLHIYCKLTSDNIFEEYPTDIEGQRKFKE
jgi:hypothetical protein